MKAAGWLGLGVALLVLVASARADDPIGRISLGASTGYASYALGDVNDRISGVGNQFLTVEHVPILTGMDEVKFGWDFLADLKVPVPYLESFFVSGGYGVSSGGKQSPDMDNKLNIDVSQECFHVRLLYTPPFRLQEDVRFFVGGGPLIITNQEVKITQTNRTHIEEQWSEELTYSGDGLGWQFGIAAEYMVQDHMTVAVDIAYRIADVEYSNWTARDNVTLTPPPTADPEERERLHYEDTYIGHAFLDWEETLANGATDPNSTTFGPHLDQLVPLGPQDIHIDMSGMRIHFGLRFYFL